MGKWRIVERSIEILRDVGYFSCNTNELITKFYGIKQIILSNENN